MKKLFQLLRTINFGFDVLIILFFLAEQFLEFPQLLKAFGRFHPLVLHFPIVLIVAVPLLPLILKSLEVDVKKQVSFMSQFLTFAHFICAITILFGFILSKEEGYGGNQLNLHKYFGLAVLAGLIALEFVLNKTKQINLPFNVLSIVTVICITVAGHFGANLTHGNEFLMEHLKVENKPPIAQADFYHHVVQPIIKQKCQSCHNSSKAKGELLLTDSLNMLSGGETGPAIALNDLANSLFLDRINLDISHKEHMPPKGKAQLTSDELAVLTTWILTGAPFTKPVAEFKQTDSIYKTITAVYNSEEVSTFNFKAAKQSTVNGLNTNDILVEPIADGSAALYVRFLSPNRFQLSQLEGMKKINKQIVDLDLSNLHLEEIDLSSLAQFKNVQILNLNNTGLTGNQLKHIQNLKQLKYLSISGTKVEKVDLENLLAKNPVAKVYAWNSKLTEEDVSQLSTQYKTVSIVGQSNEFGDVTLALNPPILLTEKQIFTDTLTVNVKHVINGVDIRYTDNGEEPDSIYSKQFTEPIVISDNLNLTLKAFKSGWKQSSTSLKQFYLSKFIPDSIDLLTQPTEKYKGKGAKALKDFTLGSTNFSDNEYLGYQDTAMEVVYYFNEPIELNSVLVSYLIQIPSEIWPPKSVELYGGNKKNIFTLLKKENVEFNHEGNSSKKLSIDLDLDKPTKVSHIKLKINTVNPIPEFNGKGRKGWVFVDEILLR